MKVSKINWYGFIHDAVCKKYNVQEFVNSFCVRGEYLPVTVYRSVNPNRSLGHKDFLLLNVIESPPAEKFVQIRGMDLSEMNLFRYQDAAICRHCNEIVFSVMQHDMRFCSCRAVHVDGGAEYFRYGGDPAAIRIVIFDFLTDTVISDVTTASN